MPEYHLAPDAADDLEEIATYTLAHWGREQAERYRDARLGAFDAIAAGEGRFSHPIPHRSDMRSSRCRHHVVFSLHQGGNVPIIIAILHEKMDLLARLQRRVGRGKQQGADT